MTYEIGAYVCLTYEWVMAHVWIFEWGMSCVDESVSHVHMYEWVMYTRTSHVLRGWVSVTCTPQGWGPLICMICMDDMYGWVMYTCMDESCTHVWMSHVPIHHCVLSFGWYLCMMCVHVMYGWYVWMSHVHMYGWVMSHISLRPRTCMIIYG